MEGDPEGECDDDEEGGEERGLGIGRGRPTGDPPGGDTCRAISTEQDTALHHPLYLM